MADWRIIGGDERFFQVTKALHNGLQGSDRELSEEQKSTYLRQAEENARAFDERYDFVFMHDPQPAAILSIRGKDSARWIWRCHIDTSEPNPRVWAFLRPFLNDYDAAVFTMSAFSATRGAREPCRPCARTSRPEAGSSCRPAGGIDRMSRAT